MRRRSGWSNAPKWSARPAASRSRSSSRAEADSRQLRHEAEDYIDQKLAAFEVVLDRTMQTVHKGREQLRAVVEPLASHGAQLEGLYDSDEGGLFDQDEP